MLDRIWNSLEYIALFVLIIAFTFLAVYLFRRVFHRFMGVSTRLMRSNDPTGYKFLMHIGSAIIYLIGFGWAVYMMPNLRTIATSMLAGAGILAVAIGFASQQALSNIISGIFIVIFKPFGLNDRLIIRDTMTGTVEDITLRHTVIRDLENRRIIIPNSVISDEIIINADFEDGKICRLVEIGISYDSDIDLAKAIMREEVMAHPLRIDGRTPAQLAKGTDEVPVRVVALGESSVQVRAWAWANSTAEGFQMYCDLLESIKKRFDKTGIEIPFPHRTLVYKDSSPRSEDKGAASGFSGSSPASDEEASSGTESEGLREEV